MGHTNIRAQYQHCPVVLGATKISAVTIEMAPRTVKISEFSSEFIIEQKTQGIAILELNILNFKIVLIMLSC